jgi:aminoglycoside phosphotransferase (APT) family kinase protein
VSQPERRVSEDRARISAGELAIVCSRYDLGDVRSARNFRGGSRASPKALLITTKGAFLLKRRAAPAAESTRAEWLHRIALSHQVILGLAARGLPVPSLVGTRDDHNSMLQVDDQVYEIYRFVKGRPYDRLPGTAAAAGELLARCHEAMRDVRPDWPPPRRSYHAHAQMEAIIRSLPERLGNAAVERVAGELAARYAAATSAAGEVSRMPDQLIHGDWHPGNLLWTETAPPARVAAILDFDTICVSTAMTDAANGALQFALRRKAIDEPKPGTAPFSIVFDPELFGAFWAGYRRAEAGTSEWPVAAVPGLCIEAIIAEAVLPIAATGRFGRYSGHGVLRLVNRTAAGFEQNVDKLVRKAGGT